jgi:hypothetical protein
MVSFKDKNVERAVMVILGVAALAYLIFLIVQARAEDREAAEFFNRLRKGE